MSDVVGNASLSSGSSKTPDFMQGFQAVLEIVKQAESDMTMSNSAAASGQSSKSDIQAAAAVDYSSASTRVNFDANLSLLSKVMKATSFISAVNGVIGSVKNSLQSILRGS